MPSLAAFLTDFADAAVVVPVCAAVLACLLVFGQRRLAIAWALVMACVWSVMFVLKLGGYLCDDAACSFLPRSWSLVSPSGHVAGSAAAYGGLLAVAIGSCRRLVWRVLLGAAFVAIVIGVTRVELDAHSVSEVIVGGFVGVAGACLFGRLASPVSVRQRSVLLAGAAAAMLGFHGVHMTLEDQIHGLSAEALQLFHGSF